MKKTGKQQVIKPSHTPYEEGSAHYLEFIRIIGQMQIPLSHFDDVRYLCDTEVIMSQLLSGKMKSSTASAICTLQKHAIKIRARISSVAVSVLENSTDEKQIQRMNIINMTDSIARKKRT